mgnify:FL=1
MTLYFLDEKGLTEHGGAVGGGWLTDLGETVRDALATEESDNFETLFAPHCVHGADVSDQEHDCFAVETK